MSLYSSNQQRNAAEQADRKLELDFYDECHGLPHAWPPTGLTQVGLTEDDPVANHINGLDRDEESELEQERRTR